MVKENQEIGVRFELPDRPTVDQVDGYQEKLAEYLDIYRNGSGKRLFNNRYWAICYSAAVEAGLISSWQCATMPDLRPAEVGAADALAIRFAGSEIDHYIDSFTTIPPKSL